MERIREKWNEQPLFVMYCIFGVIALIFLGIWAITYISTIINAFTFSNGTLMFPVFGSAPFILTITFGVIAGIFSSINGNLKMRQEMTKTDQISRIMFGIFGGLFLEFGALLFFFIIAGYLSIPLLILAGVFLVAAILNIIVFRWQSLFYYLGLFRKFISAREELGLTKGDFRRIVGIILGLIVTIVLFEVGISIYGVFSLYSIIAVVILSIIILFIIVVGVGVVIDREFSMNAFIKKQFRRGLSEEEIEAAVIEKYGNENRGLFHTKWKWLEKHSVFPFVPKRGRRNSQIEQPPFPAELYCPDCRRYLAFIHNKMKRNNNLRAKMAMGMLLPLLIMLICIFGGLAYGNIDAAGRIVIMVSIFCAIVISISYGGYMERKYKPFADENELGEFLQKLQAGRDKETEEQGKGETA